MFNYICHQFTYILYFEYVECSFLGIVISLYIIVVKPTSFAVAAQLTLIIIVVQDSDVHIQRTVKRQSHE